MTTPFHACLLAHRLTLQGGQDGPGRIGRSLGSARVDLNPHQVQAAVFALEALESGPAQGVLLADEVGLGKTIEAGLVIAQRWAEGRRRLLVVVPAMLRKQWQAELQDKFSLPGQVVDSAAWAVPERLAAGQAVLVCSYPFAARHAVVLARIRWDLVVLDEAHRLRGASRGAVTATAIEQAFAHTGRVLLTATPLQNSLLELHGLARFLDPHLFGDLEAFKARFVRPGLSDTLRNTLLRERLQRVCLRTLRRQVQEYVQFTRRIPLTQPFTPTDEEQALYDEVSDWLRREDSIALPPGQRGLLTMVLRKLLASSTFAIAATLRKIVERVAGDVPSAPDLDPATWLAAEDGQPDFEGVAEVAEEWPASPAAPAPPQSAVTEEVNLLRSFVQRAERIARQSKGEALLLALAEALRQTQALGAARKAVVFTESRQTQAWLRRHLEERGYGGQVVTLNGTNSDAPSQAIWRAWKERHQGDGTATGVKSADVRAAIVEQFRDQASVLLATEAAAEGVNLQFCSLVVNYDLPWNPQRVEQRIGRCHRYGQKHDVVVVNFLNQRNAADQRVLELLTDKFLLFEGVFGASDEILGAVGGGVDLERRIAEIYQTCRTTEAIHAEFDALQTALRPLIDHKLAETRDQILSHFDAEVQERLRVHRDAAKAALDTRQRWLLDLLRFELDGQATFQPDEPALELHGQHLHLDWRVAEARGLTFLSQDHALAQAAVATALDRELVPACLHLRLPERGRVSRLEHFVGSRGWLAVERWTATGLAVDEHLLTVAVTDEGEVLDAELAERLWELEGEVGPVHGNPLDVLLQGGLDAQALVRLDALRQHQARLLDEESAKLSRWADDEKHALRLDLDRLDAEIQALQRQVRQVVPLEEKLALRRQERDLDRQRTDKRRALYEAQDRIDAARDRLLDDVERALQGRVERVRVLVVGWRILPMAGVDGLG
jgi:superfamily II DNA or RNA helicase